MARPSFTIAGAGIAGLTMAIALARRGFRVRVFEREAAFREAGAGLQLSPNATRILARLGVLSRLEPVATRPRAITLKRARDLATVTEVPLGPAAEARWGAPYLVVHRSDLQAALLQRVHEEAGSIELVAGATVEAVTPSGSARVTFAGDDRTESIEANVLIAADGVWSGLRSGTGGVQSHFTGYTAYRTMLPGKEAEALAAIAPPDQITAFMHPRFHLVTYPINAGKILNLVAIARGGTGGIGSWEQTAGTEPLRAALNAAHPAFADLARSGQAWTAWPIYEASIAAPWSSQGLVLIGDAAHAMPPFAAQGAAMAIEDAAVLALLLARETNIADAFAAYERIRRPRILSVAKRGAFNRFAWHAGGPVALARDMVLRRRGGEALMRDFDWLYGFDAEDEEGQ